MVVAHGLAAGRGLGDLGRDGLEEFAKASHNILFFASVWPPAFGQQIKFPKHGMLCRVFDVHVDRRGIKIRVAQQQLNGPQIHAGFEPMGGGTMAQRMGRNMFADSGHMRLTPDQVPDRITGDMAIG
jgi:hypothetical protein